MAVKVPLKPDEDSFAVILIMSYCLTTCLPLFFLFFSVNLHFLQPGMIPQLGVAATGLRSDNLAVSTVSIPEIQRK